MTRSETHPVGQREAALVEASTGADVPPSSDDFAQSSRPHVIELSLAMTAADCRERWASDGATLPVSLAVVEIGPRAGTGSDVDDVPVDCVASADDLTGIGIALTTALESWASADELLVRFDSVSVLLQHVDTATAFQFLHTVVGRLRGVGARSWFYLDPSLHDEQTIATMAASRRRGVAIVVEIERSDTLDGHLVYPSMCE